MTPSREVSEFGAFVSPGSSLSIPWQNPKHSAPCHRLAFQTSVSNFSLVRARGHFSEASMNLSIDTEGEGPREERLSQASYGFPSTTASFLPTKRSGGAAP